jgi:hypothetical protein
MKKIFFGVFVLFALLQTTTAQIENEGPRKDQIEKVMVAFITKKLELTVEEAQQFWPVFNNYKKEVRIASLGNKKDVIAQNEAILTIQKKYKPQFQRILKSEERANKVFVVTNELGEKLRKVRENRMPIHPRPDENGVRRPIKRA